MQKFKNIKIYKYISKKDNFIIITHDFEKIFMYA